MIRRVVAIVLGRLAGWLSRLLGRGGSAVPGLVAGRVHRRAIEDMVSSLPDGVVFVTGTNGKTTTTKLLVSALVADGRRVVTNRTGSNLERGVLSALLEHASWRGVIAADIAVFEADEAAVRRLAERVPPRLVVVTNLARDQLDRYGELDTTTGHVRSAVLKAGHAILNADDPRVAGLGAGVPADYYGASDPIRSLMPSDRRLHGGQPEERAAVPTAVEVVEARVDETGQVVALKHAGRREVVRLTVPGVYNAYNAAAALAAAVRLGVPAESALHAFASMEAPFGRGQVVDYRGREVVVLLVKNPAGLNQGIRLVRSLEGPVSVLIAINDDIADGRDVSWLWDARVEELADAPHRYGASGTRAADMALRLKYAGIDAWSEADLAAALDRIVDESSDDAAVYVVPTYTAMLELLQILRPGVPRHEVWM